MFNSFSYYTHFAEQFKASFSTCERFYFDPYRGWVVTNVFLHAVRDCYFYMISCTVFIGTQIHLLILFLFSGLAKNLTYARVSHSSSYTERERDYHFSATFLSDVVNFFLYFVIFFLQQNCSPLKSRQTELSEIKILRN